jgi:uncharacterized protein (DUF305 family)
MNNFIILAAVASLVSGTALAQSMANGTVSNMSPADKAFSSGMAVMDKTMSGAPMTGDADRDFVTMMLPHHQGAVAMAKTELKYGKDPILRKMAKDIIASQDQEITEMKAWQAAHPIP